MNILLTLLIASIGGFIATRLKFPKGSLNGALITVSIYNIITSNAYMPLEIRIFTQIISGYFLEFNFYGVNEINKSTWSLIIKDIKNEMQKLTKKDELYNFYKLFIEWIRNQIKVYDHVTILGL